VATPTLIESYRRRPPPLTGTVVGPAQRPRLSDYGLPAGAADHRHGGIANRCPDATTACAPGRHETVV
jgi:hypothetical protein